jgi:nucleoside-diphosphate-sugar epimerase
MKVFLAGAKGALGRELVPQLVARGHEVVGMTRRASKQDGLRALGAWPVVVDALDPDAVAQAVASAEPEVIYTVVSRRAQRDLARGAPKSLPIIPTVSRSFVLQTVCR